MSRLLLVAVTLALAWPAGSVRAQGAQEVDRETLRLGREVTRVCSACHHYTRAKRKFGPHLVGLIGREVASANNYPYSDALKRLGGVWTVDRLAEYLYDPEAYAPGTQMKFEGYKDEAKAKAAAAYMAERTAVE